MPASTTRPTSLKCQRKPTSPAAGQARWMMCRRHPAVSVAAAVPLEAEPSRRVNSCLPVAILIAKPGRIFGLKSPTVPMSISITISNTLPGLSYILLETTNLTQSRLGRTNQTLTATSNSIAVSPISAGTNKSLFFQAVLSGMISLLSSPFWPSIRSCLWV